MATKKRGAGPGDNTEETSKRYKSAIDDAASEFVCPISQELPLDPVMAEDGHVYERHAIEDWLTRKQKSPLTNEPMGKKLVAAHGVKNTIRKLVASGAISGGKAEAWQQRLEEEAAVAELRSKAEAGDAKTMAELGHAYFCARHGLQKDCEKAHEWFERADHAGHAVGTYGLGIYHCNRLDAAAAGPFLAEAGARGIASGHLALGDAYAAGKYGFAANKKLARHWYSKALTHHAVGHTRLGPQKEAAEAWLRNNPA